VEPVNQEPWTLPFDRSDVEYWADKYPDKPKDEQLVAALRSAKKRKAITLDELIEIVRWKSTRALPRAMRNTPDEVAELSRAALSTAHERLRVDYLRALHGVEWPMASVVLHFLHREKYPVLDVRALRTLGVKQPNTYTQDFWMRYVQVTREASQTLCVTMRDLDRALWQWDAENNGPLRSREA